MEGMEMNWKNKNVFVTGCTGFLGSWLTKELLAKGANVVGLVRDEVPAIWPNKISVVRGRVEDYKVVERALNEFEINTCFHLAAQAIVTVANRSPLSTFESNIKGTWNILEACRNLEVNLVVASSDKAYGTHKNLPYTEDFPLKGLHPYDCSKTCSDMLAKTYHNTYDLPVAIARCGNIYGGGDLNFDRIIPATVRSLIFDESPVIRSDGTFVRDYIYVMDAVNGYLKLAENLNKVKGEAFNFGTEQPISVLDLVKMIIKISNKKLEPKIMGTAKAEIKEQYLSSKKAKELLNWKQEYSLVDGLEETYKWYSEHFGK